MICIEKLIANDCNTLLLDVRSITATYRMTNRPPPKSPSKFLNNIFDPIHAISSIENVKSTNIIDDVSPQWKENIVKVMIERYKFLINEILQSVSQMEEALQRRKGRGNATASLNSDNQELNQISDSDKIRLQLFLDIVKFGEQMEELLELDSADNMIEYCQLMSLIGSNIRSRFDTEFLKHRVSPKFIEMTINL